MTAIEIPRRCELAIIGGGAAGVLVALHALRDASRTIDIVLFEPGPVLAEGIAYATSWPEHLLNVPVAKMSAIPEAADDFLDHLLQVEAFPGVARDALADRYVPRHLYAAYLRARLQQAQAGSRARLHVCRQSVVGLAAPAPDLQLQLDDGSHRQARRVVLACGNSMRPLPVAGAETLPATRVVQAWDYDAVHRLAGDDDLAIIGSGLSMADSVIALANAGHRGRIHVLSRHALLPLPHAHGGAVDFDPQPLSTMSLRQRLRALRMHAAAAMAQGLPWQSVMDRIRPLGQALWLSLTAPDQRRFLRHVVRYWDVHRHRIAESVHAQLVTLEQSGQLRRHRVRLQAVQVHGSGLRVQTCAGAQALPALQVAALINATGVETRATAMRNPLLRQLLAQGHARPGPHGLGLDSRVADGCLLDAAGTPQPEIQVIGSLRIGTLWESLAIPELRVQAQQAARRALV